jgi:Chalcone isomerase-like
MSEITQPVQLPPNSKSARPARERATRWLALLFFSLFSASAAAGEINGMTLPDVVTLDGKPCKLNGLGVRTKTFLAIKVYVAGLYLEAPSTKAEQILASDSTRGLTLRATHKASKDTIQSELMDGLRRNSKAQLPALQVRLDKFFEGVPALAEGQTLSLSYVPGKGTSVKATGGPEVTVPGKDFADALFSAWLGEDPLDDDLKQQLLGVAVQ